MTTKESLKGIEPIKWDKSIITVADIANGIPLTRLEEICNAERDGRLVVLPCKIGDAVYVYNLDVCDWVMSPKVFTFVLCQSGWFVNLDMGSTDKHPDGEMWCMKLSDFGKTVFLTREAAEKALKGGA